MKEEERKDGIGQAADDLKKSDLGHPAKLALESALPLEKSRAVGKYSAVRCRALCRCLAVL